MSNRSCADGHQAQWPKGLAREPHFSYRRRQQVIYMQETAPQVFML
jgi:hypothetical protein